MRFADHRWCVAQEFACILEKIVGPRKNLLSTRGTIILA